MKFCYECGQTTPGDQRFCHSCGRSYDKKICPRFHENPRWAEACTQCGSRLLSRPQPKISSGWRLLEWFTMLVTGVALAIFSEILGLGVLTEFRKGQDGLERLLLSASLLAILWSLWTYLPHRFRQLVRKSFLRRIRRFKEPLD